MWYLVAALVVLGVVAALTSLLGKKGNDDVVVIPNDCGTCNGENTKCEQECMMEAATKPVEYYDDEELDRFRHRPSDCYTDEEADEFAEVMYTLKPEDVKGWNRSLILREINVPDQIKDELVALLSPPAPQRGV